MRLCISPPFFILVIMKKLKRQQLFTEYLMEWFERNDRPLPWKGEKNPYYIWLSEIILQQTRVKQGLPYFEKFKAKFPTVEDLAKASEDEVMKLWEGLGYYSRARNLHFTAKHIANTLEGEFPDNYQDILSLKGVGPYTAAAIASFAYNLPHAVVDGNVYRVLSRFFGIETPIDTTTGRKEFAHLANQLIPAETPGLYNQAIMDFGATQCTPVNPACKSCPMQQNCIAYHKDLIRSLPIKSKKIEKRERFFNYLVINFKDEVYLNKRIQKDIWQKLHDFPLVETDQILDEKQLVNHPIFEKILQDTVYQIIKVSKPFKQVLTHQKIIAVFWELKVKSELSQNVFPFFKVKQKNIDNFAFPKIIDLYFTDKSLYLELF